MFRESLSRAVPLVLALAVGCSAESADPGGSGGNTSFGNGGSTFASGGSVFMGSGGATMAPGNGGSTTTPGSGGATTTPGNGGSTTTPGSGGTTTTGNGGATTTGSGGIVTTGAGGSTPTGTGGSTTGAGGTPASAGASSGGSGGGAPSTLPCPDGCAQLSAPFTAYKSSQSFEIYLANVVDLSAGTVNVKVRKVAGKAGGLQLIVKNGEAQSYAWAQGSWNAVSDLTAEWATIAFAVATPSTMDSTNPFDATQVKIISVQLNAGDPWYQDEAMTMEDPAALLNPTVVQVDEISLTGAAGTAPGPWPFTTEVMALNVLNNAAALAATPPYAVAGSTVTWVGP